MNRIWTIAFLFIASPLRAQDIQSDLKLLRAQEIGSSLPAKEKKSTNLLLNLVSWPGKFYRNQVSGQWGHSCYFEIPCSDFSSQIVGRYGMVKGLFLTVDRIGKCNKLSFYETLPNRINVKGKIIDSVRFYSSR